MISRTVQWKYWTLWILILADYLMTRIILINNPDIFREGNPILAWLIHRTGTVDSILWMKAAIWILVGGLLYWQIHKKGELRRINRVLSCVWVVMLIVVCYVGYFYGHQ